MVIDVQLEQKFLQTCLKPVHRTSHMEMYQGVAIYEAGINCCLELREGVQFVNSLSYSFLIGWMLNACFS